MKNLLLPWHEGFWEIYHSKLPVDWLQKSEQRVTYVAPDPLTGALNYISCPEEYYERETETQEWIKQSMINPNEDPFIDWYPFKEFDEQTNELNSLDLELII